GTVILYRKGGPQRFRRLGILFLAMFVGGGGWYVKNAVLTGNPVYPMASSVFTTPDWPEDVADRWTEAHQSHDFSLKSFVTAMAKVTLTGTWNSPVTIPFALISLTLLFRRRSPEPIRQRLVFTCLGCTVGVLIGWWCFTHRLERFAILAIPFLTTMAGIGADRLLNHTRPMRLCATVFLILGIGWNGILILTVATDTAFLVPFEKIERDPIRLSEAHRRIQRDPSISKILLTGDATPYELRKPLWYHTCWNACPLESLVTEDDPVATRRRLNEEAFSHVGVNWNEIARYRSPGNYGFSSFVTPDLFRNLCENGVLEYLPELSDQGYQFFRVLPDHDTRDLKRLTE
ncbi:MAG: hypothetical protein Q4C47_00665, partial [Planctomycetia bacterium]|nr:hypothetical protein [Planctomycetia bacterium]